MPLLPEVVLNALQSVQSCPSGPWQFPEITLGYSDDQKQPILWKILPGFSNSGHVLTWLGYNFKLVQPTGPEGYSQMVITGGYVFCPDLGWGEAVYWAKTEENQGKYQTHN